MGKKFVKKEDVIHLLNTISDQEGFIEKENLLLGIRQLDIYTEDDEDGEEAEHENKETKSRTIYNIHDTIQNINKYRHEVKSGLRKSSICNYLEKYLGVPIKEKQLKVYPTEENIWERFNRLRFGYERFINEPPFINSNIVTSLKEVGEILKITKGTLNNWQDKGIINLYDTHIAVFIDEELYQYKNRYTWFKYYDLEDIKNNIKKLK